MRIRKGLIPVAAIMTACSFLMTATESGAAQPRESVGMAVRAGGSSPYYAAYGATFPGTPVDTSSYDFSYPYFGYDYGDNLPYQKGYLSPGYHYEYGYAPTLGGFVYGVY